MLAYIVNWLLAFLVVIILDNLVVPHLRRWVSSFRIRNAIKRDKAIPPPDPPEGFKKYHLGKIEIPVMNLFGTPETPFSMKDVMIDCEPKMFHQEKDYPEVLSSVIPYLTRIYLDKYGKNWTNNLLPRLSGYTQAGETADDKRGQLTLHFGLTTFFTFLATNRSLDRRVIHGNGIVEQFTRSRTLREAYVTFPYELEKSVLANPVSANVVVISSNLNQQPNDQVLIRLRSQKVALYRNCYQVSAAGFVTPAHKDELNQPNPFVTAVEEACQEIADRLKLSPPEFKMIGLAVNWEDLDLNIYGYVETSLAVVELVADFRRDDYEGWIEGIPFTPKAVLSHIAQNRWEPVSTLAMCAVLLSKFSRSEVESEAQKVPAKTWRAFLEARLSGQERPNKSFDADALPRAA